MDCTHEQQKLILCSSGPHYGKMVCRDCERFVKWAPKPKAREYIGSTEVQNAAPDPEPHVYKCIFCGEDRTRDHCQGCDDLSDKWMNERDETGVLKSLEENLVDLKAGVKEKEEDIKNEHNLIISFECLMAKVNEAVYQKDSEAFTSCLDQFGSLISNVQDRVNLNKTRANELALVKAEKRAKIGERLAEGAEMAIKNSYANVLLEGFVKKYHQEIEDLENR